MSATINTNKYKNVYIYISTYTSIPSTDVSVGRTVFSFSFVCFICKTFACFNLKKMLTLFLFVSPISLCVYIVCSAFHAYFLFMFAKIFVIFVVIQFFVPFGMLK